MIVTLSDKNSYNEQLMLKKIANGDQKAFQRLFDIYWDRMFANGLRFLKSPELARDLTQEVFIRVWIAREKLVDVKQFEPYLYRISKNMFLDHLRKRLVATACIAPADFEIEEEELNPHKRLELNELERTISSAITFLPTQMQTAFKLSRFQGLTHEQIANEMNISKVTSQNYIARSLVIIRRYLMHHSG